jgi:hypothetical protein
MNWHFSYLPALYQCCLINSPKAVSRITLGYAEDTECKANFFKKI